MPARSRCSRSRSATRVALHLFAGELAAAASLVEEADAIIEATGTHVAPYGALVLAAWRGHEAEALELIEASTSEVIARGEGLGLTACEWASAMLYNGLGRYEDALRRGPAGREYPHDLAVLDLVAARARRGGRPQRRDASVADDALERLVGATRGAAAPTGRWASRPARARCSATARPPSASTARRSSGSAAPASRFELARAHLLYGEWLRRERRRVDAREQLRTRPRDVQRHGGRGVRRACRAASSWPPARRCANARVETRDELTAQEAQIARLARDGLSNPEIGAQLFISPRTVEYHLHKVFTKLGISSRIQLDGALPSEPRPAQPV